MFKERAQIAVIGAGFGGSLTALLLKQIGLKPLLVERGRHPRFSIGESSTPQADLILATLARKYDLPRLAPLAAWGPWQRTYPDLPCGLKLGFSYFQHQSGWAYQPTPDNRNLLLVAASAGTEDADTHWHRATFDEFLLKEAVAAGIPYFDQTEVTELRRDAEWTLGGSRLGEPVELRAEYLVDASGDGRCLARLLQLPDAVGELQTNSRALLSHFRGLRKWNDLLLDKGAQIHGYPFPCDDAALHHVFDGGWMYVLPFNTGVTSAGFALDGRRRPVPTHLSPEEEWAGLMQEFPSIGWQFQEAQIVDPPGRLVRTGRLQRFVGQASGPGWTMLPTTVGILDPLHSTGNAHTLSGIERLIALFERHWRQPTVDEQIAQYGHAIRSEVRLIDRIVHGCYEAFSNFECFEPFSMFYFAGAMLAERQRRNGLTPGYLCSDDVEFPARVEAGYQLLLQTLRNPDPLATRTFNQEIRNLIAPFNFADLCDPNRRNLYPFVP